MMQLLPYFFLCICSLLVGTPPKEIPDNLYDSYTDKGTTHVVYRYFDDSIPSKGVTVYTKKRVNKWIKRAQRRKANYYGQTDLWLYQLLDKNPKLLRGKTVAIMGSAEPWYEAVVLAYGGKPYTIEYNPIETNDSRLTLVTVSEFKKNPRRFDVILSISSFEHDGLGRYGDPLDPNGDLKAMKTCLDMLNAQGKMILAVPIGKGCLVWNAHRIYGKKRLAKLIDGWRVIDQAGNYQEMFDYPHGDHFHQPILLLEPLH